MAPYVPVSSVIASEVQFTQEGQLVEITIDVHVVVAITTALLNSLAAIIFGWWDSTQRFDTASALTITGVRMTDLTTSTGLSQINGYGGATPNGSGTAALPNNVTATITKATPLRGRSYRGRNFIPGIDRTELTATDYNILLPASVAAFVSNWVALDAALVAGGFQPVIVSRFSGGAPRLVGVATPITSYRMNDVIDSQRRRLPGRGV